MKPLRIKVRCACDICERVRQAEADAWAEYPKMRYSWPRFQIKALRDIKKEKCINNQ